MPPAQTDIFAAAPVRQDRPYQPSPFDGILEKSRDLICERLDEAVALMLDSAHEIITQLIKDTQIREEWRLYEEARKVATEQRETIEKHFKAAYRADFQRRSDRARKIGKPFDKLDCSFEELELIGEDDYDETLKFNDMAQKLRTYCDEELSALDQRVGVLLGDAGLAAKDNPFSPEVVCDAFKLACQQLDCDASVRRVFLKLFDDQVLDEIRSVYKAVNALLVRNSILPQIRYSIARGGDAGSTGGAAHGQSVQESAASNAASGAAQDLFSMLQTLVTNNAAAAARMPGGVPMTASGAGMALPAAGVIAAGANAVPGGSGTFPMVSGAVGVAPNLGGVVDGAAGLMPAAVSVFPGSGAMLAGEAATLPAGMMPLVGATPAAAGVVVLQGAELLNALTRLQLGDSGAIASETDSEAAREGAPAGAVTVGPVGLNNVLHQLKTSTLGAGMNPLDRMTLDIIAMLFDELFDDPKVPSTIKGLIGRLQIPMLKVSISDKSFFSTKSHPARRLLDAVGEVALRLPADFNDAHPLFARIDSVVQQLVEGYQDDLQIFTTARDELLELMAEEDRRIEQEALVQAKQVEEMEHLALARNAAQQEVLARIRVRELPPEVLKFVAQEWIKLLLVVHAREGIESEAWKDAVEAMDDLIWSVEPKNTPEDRRKLAALIPSLIKRLTAGIENAAIADAVRIRFFSELMTYHMQAISSTPRVAAEAAAESKPQSMAESADAFATPADPAQPLAQAGVMPQPASAEAAPVTAGSLDFTAPITVQNPFGAGEVAVDNLDLDFTAQALEGAKAKREASIRRALDNLKMGHWVEFRDAENEGKSKPGRLIFVSPKKTRYLFATDRAGKEIIQCSRAEIGRRFLAGQAVKMDEPPEDSLFDRIMNGLLGKLRLSGRPALFAQ
ncbi:MAG: DUF1631 family protein [Betaproteobacteria bacterium]|nr:DUF1631 family protein [Betaproteobacteria bacterium]